MKSSWRFAKTTAAKDCPAKSSFTSIASSSELASPCRWSLTGASPVIAAAGPLAFTVASSTK